MMPDAIRPAGPGDYAAYQAMFAELGVDDPIPPPDRFSRDLAPKILIYERDGAAIGYVLFDRLAADGYIRNLVVAPDARGGGVGGKLMSAAAGALRERGASADWHLNVKVDNAPAIKLYERLGFAVEHRSMALRVPWASVANLAGEPAAIRALPVEPAEDDDVERGLGLLLGRIEMARQRGGQVIRQLRDAALAPVGLACFDPAFPGAFPFRVARPSLARPLLEALAPHARPGDLDLQIVVEDDDALTDALLAAGAQVRLRMLHYRGPLPA